MSVTQVMEQYQSILEEEIHDIAYKTGAVKRQGKLGVETFAQMMIFGFWQDPDLRLSGLAQIGGRREVFVTESAISQRFTPECATMFLEIMQRCQRQLTFDPFRQLRSDPPSNQMKVWQKRSFAKRACLSVPFCRFFANVTNDRTLRYVFHISIFVHAVCRTQSDVRSFAHR